MQPQAIFTSNPSRLTKATSINIFVISGNTTTIEGIYTLNYVAGYTFKCEVKDTNPDYFVVIIKDGTGAIVDPTTGTVAGGDFMVTLY